MITSEPGTIVSGQRALAIEELNLRAARAASMLRTTGARPGGAIAILMRNDVCFLEALFAAHFLGAYAVPINWHFKQDEIGHILRDCEATHLVVHADLLPDVRACVPEHVHLVAVAVPSGLRDAYGIAADRCAVPAAVPEWSDWLSRGDPAPVLRAPAGGTMSYTSGTTGRPKGVRRQPVEAGRRREVAEQSQRWFGNRPGMRTALIGPLYHSVQATYATAAVRAGGGVVVVTPRFDAEELLRLVEAHRLTHLHLVPVMMQRLVRLPREVRERYDLGSLEFVVHGSAPCPPLVKRELIAWWGPIVHEYYGTSEAGMVTRASSEEWLAREGTVGRAWPGRTVRIYDERGRVAPAGVEGEVYMSLGLTPDFTYLHADAKRAEVERDGLVTSGDVGYLDEDGYLYLCDRKADVVISGGVNVYPAEVEAALAGHPAVNDCAVFGVPDEEFGESLMAVVEPRPGQRVAAGELRVWLRERLASFKVPRTFALADELPRDESGKIRKRLLRDPHWSGTGRRI